jgi:hypothetical protein
MSVDRSDEESASAYYALDDVRTDDFTVECHVDVLHQRYWGKSDSATKFE